LLLYLSVLSLPFTGEEKIYIKYAAAPIIKANPKYLTGSEKNENIKIPTKTRLEPITN
jgi:hypothetical protein